VSKATGAARTFVKLMTPSWFEFFSSVIISLGIGGYLVTEALRRDINFQEYVRQTSSTLHDTNTDSYHALINSINGNQLIGDATIFCLWAIVGLMLYSLVTSLWHLTQREVGFFERLRFAPKSGKKFLIENALVGLALRFGALVGLVAFGSLFRYVLLPKIIALIFDVFSPDTATAVLHASSGIILLIASLHVIIVLVRISLLRTRVFFTKYSYVD
jgi:hypothetical protein